MDTGELQQTLDSRGGNQAGAAGSRDELHMLANNLTMHLKSDRDTYSDSDRTALAALLRGQRVRLTQVVAPVSSPDGQNAELGENDSRANGGSNLLGGLDSETDVALRVANDDNGLETGPLTGTGLLLDGFDL